jgi:replicative DNA helicase
MKKKEKCILLKDYDLTAHVEGIKERRELFRSRTPDNHTVRGISTGLTDLDNMIEGFEPSQLVILAGRPAMGKTALALNLAENIAIKRGTSVGYISLEMSKEQLIHRIMGARPARLQLELKKRHLFPILYL